MEGLPIDPPLLLYTCELRGVSDRPRSRLDALAATRPPCRSTPLSSEQLRGVALSTVQGRDLTRGA